MKEKITTILLTFAIVITGINAPTDKANAETSEAKTTTETATEAPSATPAPASTMKPAATVWPAPTQPAIGTLATANGGITIIYTEDGWKRYYSNSTPTPPTTPEPTERPRREDTFDVEGYGVCKEGKTAEIAKGAETRIFFGGWYNTKWTSSNTKVASVKVRKGANTVVKAKKYGKTVLTAEYAGYKISIVLKVVKNGYKGKMSWNNVDEKQYYKKPYGEFEGLGRWEKNGPITVKYNKKGGLTIKYTTITKWRNPKEKKKIIRELYGMYVKIEDQNFKKIVDCTVNCPNMTLSPKKSKAGITFTVPRKYLPKKKMNLRSCKYYIMPPVHKDVPVGKQ